jgi:membrane protein
MTQSAEADTGAVPPDAGAPEKPTHLSARAWWAVLKRTFREFQDDNLMDWAAALTYFGVLALFPCAIVFVALLGVLGQYPETFNALLDIVRQLGPSQQAIDSIARPLERVIQQKQAAGALLSFGLLGALWSASGYVGAFMRAANVVYEVKEGRPFWKLRPLQIMLTIALVLVLAAVAISLVVTGPLAEAIGNVIGLGDFAVTAWSIAKWPIVVIVMMGIFAGLFYAAPNVRQPHFRWVSPGGIVAVLVWIVASVLFGLYVANFGSYNATYGALGGAIGFLVWLWISNIAVLLGAEFDAELARGRQIEDDVVAPDEEPFLEPRDTRAMD